MEDAQQELCALCGAAIAPGQAQFVIEGSACEACAKARATTRARKLMPMALMAVLCALVPVFVGYATRNAHNRFSTTTSTTTRILIFSSTQSNELNMQIEGADPGPMMYSYSDPVAIFFGGGAVLLGAIAIFLAMKAKNRRSMIFAGIALAAGAAHILRGLGKI